MKKIKWKTYGINCKYISKYKRKYYFLDPIQPDYGSWIMFKDVILYATEI
jgi:hypothetical protein